MQWDVLVGDATGVVRRGQNTWWLGAKGWADGAIAESSTRTVDHQHDQNKESTMVDCGLARQRWLVSGMLA